MRTLLASVAVVSAAIAVTAVALRPAPVDITITIATPDETGSIQPKTQGRIPYGLKDDIIRIAGAHGFEPAVLAAVAYKESRFQADACSGEGACGLMQFMPETAKAYRVDRSDPVSSLEGGGRYLAHLRARFGNDGLALAAYNWGPGNVSRWLRKGARLDRAPRETRDYVMKITGRSLKVWAGRTRSIGDLIANVETTDYTVQMRNEL